MRGLGLLHGGTGTEEGGLGAGGAVQSGVMKMAAVCVLWAAGLAAQTVGEMPEPPAYGQLYYWDAAARALRAVPYEMVRVRGKREERVAEFRGARAKLRFVEGAVPALVIAYASLPAGEWGVADVFAGVHGGIAAGAVGGVGRRRWRGSCRRGRCRRGWRSTGGFRTGW